MGSHLVIPTIFTRGAEIVQKVNKFWRVRPTLLGLSRVGILALPSHLQIYRKRFGFPNSFIRWQGEGAISVCQEVSLLRLCLRQPVLHIFPFHAFQCPAQCLRFAAFPFTLVALREANKPIRNIGSRKWISQSPETIEKFLTYNEAQKPWFGYC